MALTTTVAMFSIEEPLKLFICSQDVSVLKIFKIPLISHMTGKIDSGRDQTYLVWTAH